MKRNLDFEKLQKTVDFRPEYIMITEGDYCASFLLRVFELEHLALFDKVQNNNVSQNCDAEKIHLIQKWTWQKIRERLHFAWSQRHLWVAMKKLKALGLIEWEYAKNGKAYLGHDIFFRVDNVQDAINKMIK